MVWCWLGLSSCVPPGGRRRWAQGGAPCGGVLAGAMRGLFCLLGVVFAALRSACLGGCGWLLGCGCDCVDRLAGVGSVLVRGPPHGGACCVGACPPPSLGVLCWCVPPPDRGVCCVACGAPHGGACCVGAWPHSWWGVLCWCPSAAVVVCGVVCLAWVVVVCSVGCGCGYVACLAGVGAVLVRAPPPPVEACRVCVWPPPSWGVLCRRVLVSVRGVVASSMLSLFCWFAVVSAAVRPALSGVGCLWCLPGRGWCCAGACLPPPCWSVLCLCVAPPMVGRAVLVCAPPMVGRAALVCGPPPGGACCVGAWPSSWWGGLCWCLHTAVVVFGLGCCRPLGGLRLRFFCLLGRGWCWAGACPPPPLLGRAAFERGPSPGGACCVGVFGFWFVVL